MPEHDFNRGEKVPPERFLGHAAGLAAQGWGGCPASYTPPTARQPFRNTREKRSGSPTIS